MPTDQTRPDAVDRVIAGWSRARPDLDTTALSVFSRISRLARHLESARREAFTASGIEGWEFDVLSALRRADGEPLSPGALLRQTMVTSGTMSTRLDKLEARSLVRRERDPRDGRAVLVRLQEEGITRVDAAIERLLDAERRALSAVPPAEQEQLASTLRTLLLPFEPDGD
ncbi:MarR family transcriptional regulator [Brachybacterium sp. JHP9]|uniref:MarR family transcriptional regulator n=1 Tax=Brachybacterium equifaecis TaxID=2910770 RepID=A0ABT0QVV9_9MICO|nr:MarR family transcriptional regulator [Brachybacterium equifaecis]MCL6421798.1 MarR family transcriptional regulator [Brachybacterium equifaecis]